MQASALTGNRLLPFRPAAHLGPGWGRSRAPPASRTVRPPLPPAAEAWLPFLRAPWCRTPQPKLQEAIDGLSERRERPRSPDGAAIILLRVPPCRGAGGGAPPRQRRPSVDHRFTSDARKTGIPRSLLLQITLTGGADSLMGCKEQRVPLIGADGVPTPPPASGERPISQPAAFMQEQSRHRHHGNCISTALTFLRTRRGQMGADGGCD